MENFNWVSEEIFLATLTQPKSHKEFMATVKEATGRAFGLSQALQTLEFVGNNNITILQDEGDYITMPREAANDFKKVGTSQVMFLAQVGAK